MLVVDTATWRALDRVQEMFRCHPAITIRGRSRAEDVYALAVDEVTRAQADGDRPLRLH